jgi:hypothetical protein
LKIEDYESGERRFENRASSTNKNQSGYYFQQEQKYNIPLYSDKFKNESGSGEAPQAYSEEVQVLKRESHKQRPMTVGPVMSRHSHHKSRGDVDDWKRLAREAGINPDFPGTTEQKSKYTRPPVNNYKDFKLNPQMEFHRLSRPFTAAAFRPLTTEYQSNYKIPDGNLIDKFPWIKQY